jgi:hypothetical protein
MRLWDAELDPDVSRDVGGEVRLGERFQRTMTTGI